MADSVNYAISVTPKETINDENAQSHTILASEVGRTLGASGTAAVAAYNGSAANQGYLNAAANYLEAIDSDNNTDISSESSATFVFIKNTGKAFSSATELGADLAKSLKVMSASTTLAVLDAGEGIVFKDDNAGINCTGIHVRTVDTNGSDNDSAGHLAVEYLVVD